MSRSARTIVSIIFAAPRSQAPVLSSSAAPSITDIVSNANNTQADYIVSQVQSGLKIYWANHALQNDGSGDYPSRLDSAANGDCNGNTACFSDVLDNGINSDAWTKDSDTQYTHNLSGQSFGYNENSGTFE